MENRGCSSLVICHSSFFALRFVTERSSNLLETQFGSAAPVWHVTCGLAVEKGRMATKVKLMRMLQELRGLAEITARRPQQRPPGLFLIQLRSHLLHTTHPLRKRILVDVQDQPDIPDPVKITHLNGAPSFYASRSLDEPF